MIDETKIIRAAGTVFLSKKTKRLLLNFRSENVSHPKCFGFWGGKLNSDEKIYQGLTREVIEELGFIPRYIKTNILDQYISPDGKFKYYSFVVLVDDEFIPHLNHESCGYCWLEIGCYPRPLHPGARVLLEDKNIIALFKKLCE